MSVPVIVAVQLPAVEPHPDGTLADSVPFTVFPAPSVTFAPAALSSDAEVGGLLVLKYTVESADTTETATTLTVAVTGATLSSGTVSLTVTWYSPGWLKFTAWSPATAAVRSTVGSPSPFTTLAPNALRTAASSGALEVAWNVGVLSVNVTVVTPARVTVIVAVAGVRPSLVFVSLTVTL